MDRNQFIKTCGFACLGAIGLATLLPACTASKHLNADLQDNKLIVPLSAFHTKGEGGRRYIVVQNEQLNYPIVVFREPENSYTALLLRCSHQYNELNVNGELLTCPAHGSEFDSKGNIVSGPAEDRLRSFPTNVDNVNLYILLA